MAGTEDISLKVALDDRQAKAGLDALRMQTDAVATAADSGAGGLAKLQQRVDGVNKLAGPAASAISGVTGAVGGLSSQAGAAVGAVANLAGAFASGGPLALAIIGIGTGVSWLTSKYNESSRAAEKAADDQIKAAKATADRIEGLTKGLEGRIRQASGVDEATAIYEDLRTRLEETVAYYKQLQGDEANFRQSLIDQGMAFSEAGETYKEELRTTAERVQELAIDLSNAEGAYEAYNEKLALAVSLEAKKKEADDAIKDALTKKTAAIKNDTKAIRDNEAAMDDVIRRMREQEDFAASVGPTAEMFQQAQLKQFQDAEKAKADAASKAAEDRVKIEEEAAKRIEDIQNKTAQVGVDVASGATALLIGTVNDLVIGAVSGQEMAAEKAAAAFLSGIGNQLVGIGTKALIEGAIISANPLTPGLGAPMVGLGALAIATGIGLGAAGAGISAAISGAPTGAGTAGPSPATTATTATPMGAGRISSGGRDGGGPMQEAITYVFNAPVFGDQNRSAKQVAMLQRRARRDLLLA
jgi:hypothetical protein